MVELVPWDAPGRLFKTVEWPEAPHEFRVPVPHDLGGGRIFVGATPVGISTHATLIAERRFVRMDDWNHKRPRAHYMAERGTPRQDDPSP